MRRGVAILLSVLVAGALTARAERPTEHEVKAAFLYNFAKFVKWPEEDARAPTFVIAVLGEDPFGSVLDRIVAGKTVLDHKVEVKRVSSLETAGRIHILFVGASERPRLEQVVKRLEGTSVLTVGAMDSFTERGGMIGFKVREDVVQFEINLDQVEKARLKMSSQLIRLARHVITTGKGS